MTLGSKITPEDVGIMNSNSALSEATEALMVLGYDKASVLAAIKGLDVSKMESGDIIKNALKKLSRT